MCSSDLEGDYFICVTWTFLPAGDSQSSHIKFTLTGNTSVNTVIPSHFTKPEKYSTLLEKYTPDVKKELIQKYGKEVFILNEQFI